MKEKNGNVVIIGAGRSGRGLHGEFCYKDNYNITFADIDADLIHKMKKQGQYISFSENETGDGFNECVVKDYKAYQINENREDYLSALADADIIFTATFDDAFPSIVKDIKDSIDVRIEKNITKQFALIVGANYIGLKDYFDKAFKEDLTEKEYNFYQKHCVLAEQIIYRVSSFPTPEQKEIDEISVQSDVVDYLQVNTSQFAKATEIRKPSFFKDEDDTLKFMHCKIWNVNTSHCSLAYLGQYYGYKNVCEAANDPKISKLAWYASKEAYAGLAARYGMPKEQNVEDVLGLWNWYQDVTMKDTVERVGNDPIRKLRKGDRFIGAALNAMEYGVLPIHICQNAAYGFYFHNEGDPRTDKLHAMIKENGIEKTIQEVCGLDLNVDNEKIIYEIILKKYYDLKDDDPVKEYLDSHDGVAIENHH